MNATKSARIRILSAALLLIVSFLLSSFPAALAVDIPDGEEKDAVFSDGTRYYFEGEYLLGVAEKEYTLGLLDKISSKSQLRITDKNENDVSLLQNRYVCTGDALCIGENRYPIAVIGDADGDGTVTVNDYLAIKHSFKNAAPLDNVYFKAADVNKDGKLTVTDYLSVKRSIKGLFDLLKFFKKVNGICLYEFSFDEIPDFDTGAYVALNGNEPYFEEDELTDKAYEYYGEKDELGRCTAAVACAGTELMSDEPRGDISSVTPTGWRSVKYDIVPGKYLYNRCHLIGYQLTAENANDRNLITGTRYLNVTGMLPFENMVADYIKETNNHVLYRVTPIFIGGELVARGLIMEAFSIEDDGDGICFCIFAYNCQPGIVIDYATGDSALESEVASTTETATTETEVIVYIVNLSTKKFHYDTCRYAASISEDNKLVSAMTRDELIDAGYQPCGVCKP